MSRGSPRTITDRRRQLGETEVRAFLDHLLRDRGMRPATLRVYRSRPAVSLRRDVAAARRDAADSLSAGRARAAAGGAEPGRSRALLAAAPSLKHRAMMMAAYGAGLRVSELCALTVADIDSARMLVRVREGKGAKDRYVMLSPRLLAILRAYWRHRPPRGPYLFPSPRPGQPLSRKAVWHAAAARRAAGPVAQAGHAARSSSQFRHTSARSGDRHPRHPGVARPSVDPHDRPLRAGVAGTRRHGREPARRAVADDVLVRVARRRGAPRARRLLCHAVRSRTRGGDDRARPRSGGASAAGALSRAAARAPRDRRLPDARPRRPCRRVRALRLRAIRLPLVSQPALSEVSEPRPGPVDRAAHGARPRRRLLPRRLHAPGRAALARPGRIVGWCLRC